MAELALLFANSEKRTQIAHRLVMQHRVSFELPIAGGADVGGDLDAVVVDVASLDACSAWLSAERGRRTPAALPIVLVDERQTVAALRKPLWNLVDDVVLCPNDRREIAVRIDRALRTFRGSRKAAMRSRMPNRERTAAQRVQTAALPRRLPHVPGLTFGAYYRPGTDAAHVGGDWYDALALPDGRVLFSIGDVCGTGLDAAIAMASVRQVVRGAAQINPDPAVLLDAAHRTLRAESQESWVTAFVGIFDPITGLLLYASAGHPRPFLRRADGSIVELEAPGSPLGLPFTVERSVSLATLPLGSLLILYTDGLTEAKRDLFAGEDGLRRAIADDAVRSAPNVALAIAEAVIGDAAPDDVAILAVARVERDAAGERLSHWSFDTRDARAARDVRAELVAELRRVKLDEAGVANAELVFSELIGNVVRYAPRWVDVTLDSSGVSPVLHVLDAGPGFGYLPRLPVEVLSERGRGLYIVAQLTDDFHVTKRPHGGSHARAVLSR